MDPARITTRTAARIAAAVAMAMGLALATWPAAAEPPVLAPDASDFTLANGLQVVVIPDHRAPVVTHMVWYRVGAADDPPGKSGIAHFLEHLMFRGTASHPDADFSTRVAAIGGNDNAFTTDEATAFHQTVAREHLGLMMAFEADRMANLVIDEAGLRSEREVVMEERRSRVDNSPGARLGEAIDAALYQNSRYGVPSIGWAHEIAALERDDALALYARSYVPNNAFVIVAGDVAEDEVRALAEETYGQLPRGADQPERIRLAEPEPQAARAVTLADPRVSEPSVRRLYLVPSYMTAAPGEAEALDVLGEILGGGATSRLYRRLVMDEGAAIGAGAAYRGTRIGDGTFTVAASPRGALAPDALVAAIDSVIADLVETGVTDEEVLRARRRIHAGVIYSRDSASALARRVFGPSLAAGMTIADIQAWPARIDAVTAGDVDAVARRYLDIDRSVTGYLLGVPREGRS
jgi:zinc protease